MADRLYLSLWYPNFRLEALPAALTGVLRQFAVIGAKRVSAASAYPINFTEPPTYQRIYVNSAPDPAHHPPGSQLPTEDSDSIEAAVAEATEQLHDDMAYEFEMRWQLWTPEEPTGEFVSRTLAPGEEEDLDLDEEEDREDAPTPRLAERTDPASPDDPWRLRAHTVRILGFGPRFDMAGFEQNGHLLVDFGLDTPWVLETLGDQPLDFAAQLHIQQNVEKLLAFTLLVEKNCGISSRLLWTESGEPLAEKLIARLQRVN
jgi:hypothetical protein